MRFEAARTAASIAIEWETMRQLLNCLCVCLLAIGVIGCDPELAPELKSKLKSKHSHGHQHHHHNHAGACDHGHDHNAEDEQDGKDEEASDESADDLQGTSPANNPFRSSGL